MATNTTKANKTTSKFIMISFSLNVYTLSIVPTIEPRVLRGANIPLISQHVDLCAMIKFQQH